MIVRRMRPDEADRVNALFSVAFEAAPSAGPADGRSTIRHWGAFTEEGELMSGLSVTDFTVRFDGKALPMGGVGAVGTFPPFRRRGGVAACFSAALRELYAGGTVFSYLYPFSTTYYRRFGYENCVRRLRFTLDLAQLPPPRNRGGFRMLCPGSGLETAVRKVDEDWEARYNLEVIHGGAGWAEKADPFLSREYTYVWFGEDGTPLSYLSFRTCAEAEGRNLVCSRFRFTGAAGFDGLLQVFRSLAADHRYAKFSLHLDGAILYALPEWSLGALRRETEIAGMVRAVNAAEALKAAAYRGGGELCLELRDALIPENDGRFAIAFAGGRALNVERTEAAPDAVLDIAAFSAMLAGVCVFSDAAAWMPGVTVCRPDAPLDRLFYRKKLMITDYF